MIATAQEIIDDALMELGIISAPGQAASPGNTALALSRLNQLIDMWNTRQERMLKADRLTFPLTPAQPSYTLGPTGDWVAQRPIGPRPGNGINQASVILPGVPNIFIPITILTNEQWAAMRLREIPGMFPLALYNDGGNPNSTVYLYGTAPAGYEIELWVTSQLSGYVAASTSLDVPPGYRMALALSLAEQLLGPFARIIPAIPIGLETRARDARAMLERLRTGPTPQRNDTARFGNNRNGSSYNWRTGGYI